MIPGVKQVNLTSVVQSVRENEPVKQAAGQNKTQSTANLQRAAILTGSLAGLAVLGYAGVKAFRGKAPDIKTAEALPEIIYENLPPQAVIKCREWLEHIRDLPAHVWKVDENKCCTVPSPDSKHILFEFFNRLKPEEEKAFVQEYCRMTGFPDLGRINANINKEIMTGLDNMVKDTGNRVLFAAYDSNCSVGRGLGFPGSDCDGLYVLVEKPCSERVNRFILGSSINQRLVETTGEHYPEVFCMEEILKLLDEVDELFPKFRTPEKIAEYKKNLLYTGDSYLHAGQFNIDLAEQIPDVQKKNAVCQAGFFVEMLRGGKILVNNLPENILRRIKDSAMYKYSNMTRQEGQRGKMKPKLENRPELCRKFYNMSDKEKFEVCRDMLEHSCGLKSKTAAKDAYESFDMGDIMDMYKKITSFFDSRK